MKIKYPFKIKGIGKYLPRNKIVSEELEASLSIPSGWSVRYSGVSVRYHAGVDETNAFMGARSLENAMEDAGLQTADLDMLISAAATFDCPLPNQASLIKNELNTGNSINFPCVDINTTCLSFVTAMDYAAKSLDGKEIQHIAIVSSEIASKGLDPNNWETATLFGDAAVAVIISYDPSAQAGLIKYGMKTYSTSSQLAVIEGGGNRYHIKDHPYDPALHSFKMEGIKLLKMAKLKIPEFMDHFFSTLPCTINEIDWIMPHQASKAGLMVFQKHYKLSDEQMPGNLSRQGNCISASIPSLLYDAIKSGRVQEGQTILLCGTSAGFSIGGALLIY